ncbi:MAG: hypothetical protein N4A35_12285 [Flavobacteriales bacterium]|jgi:hypothetical protein|nr:hypothetical protein [Flavobacteriales bacterium]
MKKIILILFVAVGLWSCEEEQEVVVDKVVSAEEEQPLTRTEQIENIVYNIPSPTETVSILKRAGAVYVFDYPNDPLNAEDYQTLSKQGLNMGVYGADLTYATVFNKTTETSFYLSCVTKLGRKLGVEQVFNEDVNERIQDNVENRDSMQVIVNETFWELDAYLKEQGRENVSSLVVAGGWIESLYLAVQFVKANPENEEMRQRIAEQKYSLDNLVGLIKSYKNKAGVDEVLASLLELKEVFDKIEEKKTAGGSTAEDGSMLIGSVITLDVTDELMNEIIERVEEIRTEIVS